MGFNSFWRCSLKVALPKLPPKKAATCEGKFYGSCATRRRSRISGGAVTKVLGGGLSVEEVEAPYVDGGSKQRRRQTLTLKLTTTRMDGCNMLEDYLVSFWGTGFLPGAMLVEGSKYHYSNKEAHQVPSLKLTAKALKTRPRAPKKERIVSQLPLPPLFRGCASF